MNNPVMYADPSGHLAVSIGLIISVVINATISVVMEVYEDRKDGELFNDKDLLDYFGAGLSGAISGMAGSATSAIALGGIASMVKCVFSGETSANNMMTSIFTGAMSGLIGFGIGEVIKYGVSFVEAGVIKMASKVTSNYQVNKFLTKIGMDTIKVGFKNLKGLTKQFASLENNHIATIISNSITGVI